MKRFSLILSLMAVLLSSCHSNSKDTKATDEKHKALEEWFADNGKLKVLCTIEMITDIVERIGAKHINCYTLIQGELDPHSYELVKGDDEFFQMADVIFYNGLGLEHGPSLRRQLEGNPKAIALGDWVRKQNPQMILDVGGQPDPHIWMDIKLWMKILTPVMEALSRARPSQADSFKEHTEALEEAMAQKDSEIYALLQAVPASQRYLVTSHDAFCYFARHYLAMQEELESGAWEKRCEAPEGLAPEGQLSTVDIQRLINHLATYRILVLFPESNISRDSIRKIIDAGSEKGLMISIARTPLYSDAMGPPGSTGDEYLKMMQHNAETIARHLKEATEK